MTSGEYFVRRDRVVDPNTKAAPSVAFGELDAYIYTIADDDGPLAEVHIDVKGRVQGPEVFSIVSVRTLGAGAVSVAFERAVSPPLYDEFDRQAVAFDSLVLVRQMQRGPEQLLDDTISPQKTVV